MEQYKLPGIAAEAEFTEKKSRFIGYLTPISSESDALSCLRSVRERHREATHNVYAYRLKEGGICRHSDDGEPSGTAGMPLLDVFIKQDIYDFCCVATRYFGGVLLGAGGLVRAYSRCGALALEASGIGIMREMALCSITMAYARYEPVKRLICSHGAELSSEDFGVEVDLKFSLPAEDLPPLQMKITELTAGELEIHVEGTRYASPPVRNGCFCDP